MKQNMMLAMDRINEPEMRKDLVALCEERGIESHYWFVLPEHQEAYLAACDEVYAKWHTTKNFKVGDKVYVSPGRPNDVFKNYLRATVTEVGDPKWGYHLRAFLQDLPGIYMFNMWDKDLLPRTGKANLKLPDEF